MGSQVFLPAADSRSPVDLEAELVRLRRDLPHGPSRTRLAMRRLQEVQALRLGRQGSAIAVGPWAHLMGHVQATCNKPRHDFVDASADVSRLYRIGITLRVCIAWLSRI